MIVLRILTRISAFMGKEVVSTVRRPGVLLSLVFGPFLIMALFGYGYTGYRHPIDTIVVVPQGSDLPRDPNFYADLGGPPVHIVAVSADADTARQQLERREAELVVIAPTDAGAKFRAGQQEVITVAYDEIDPVMVSYIDVLAQEFADRVNQQIIATAVKQGETYALGPNRQVQIPPNVVAAPTRIEAQNVAPTQPNVTAFFAPAVLALVLQHMGVTLTALSLVRERLGGAMELFRISPTSSTEILFGKYVAFGFLNFIVAALVVGLMLVVFHVPLLANIPFVALVVALLTFASLGLGLLISALAGSERQAVQLSLLVLLASVFFSGFVVPLRDFDPLVRDLAYALPVTHGIRLLQDAFLWGEFVPWNLAALAGIGVALLVVTDRVLARSMRPV